MELPEQDKSRTAKSLLTISGVILTLLVAIKNTIDVSSPLVGLVSWTALLLIITISISLGALISGHWDVGKNTYRWTDIISSAIFFISMILLAVLIAYG